MNDRMNGRPEAMTDFGTNLKNPNLVLSTALPAGCGGAGMAECAGLRSALTLATTQANQFLTQVNQGFDSFRAITTACGNEYAANDAAGAVEIARTMAALPAQTTALDQAEQNDSTTPGRID
jgi:hypothetical protein